METKKSDVLFPVYVFTVRGKNGVFDVQAAPESFDDEVKRQFIIGTLRLDREKNMVGNYVPKENPSLDLSVANFIHEPLRIRQLKSGRQPLDMDGYSIIDAFVCLGSRFGLSPIQCYVEVCEDHGLFWAHIYYVCDCSKIETIVDITRVDLGFDQEYLQRKLAFAIDLNKCFQVRSTNQEAMVVEAIAA